MGRMNIATIDDPEFINLQPADISPLMSSCEIKVLYLGQNRNNSYISKDVAINMAKTLRGAPIVGWYREDKKDFGDHGQRIICEGGEIKFECLTTPYGFVAPDAKVWFQDFEVTDDFGNTITRTYLMTTGYLWTKQFPELKQVLEQGNPHSMELDKDTMSGQWSKDYNSGIEFFIINDAIFSKLCILGNDVEPCFEESDISAPQVSKTFTKMDDNFKTTLFNMMQELQFALKGGTQMEDQNQSIPTVEEPVAPVTEEPVAEPEGTVEQPSASVEEGSAPEGAESTEFAKTEDDEKKEEGASTEDGNKGEDDSQEPEKKDDEKDKEKYALLEQQFADLNQKYSELEANYQALVEFKKQIDDEKKDALIKQFYMLSDEDKKEVIENKCNYSLDEIEAKLSVICVRKKVNFDLEDSTENDKKVEDPIVTFNYSGNEGTEVPAWLAAIENTHNRNN